MLFFPPVHTVLKESRIPRALQINKHGINAKKGRFPMNKMTLIGNLTRDPETRTVHRMGAESSVTNFTVAVNEGFGDRKRTEYVRIAAWNGLGSTCSLYLKKGMKVYAEGSVSVSAWLNAEGSAVGQLEMRLDRIEFLSKVFGTEDTVSDEPDDSDDDIDALL